MLHIQTFTFNPLSENTYVIFDETREAAIIDPGCYEKYERQELDDYIQKEGLQVTHLLNTHCHIDHVLGNYHVKEKYRIPLWVHTLEQAVLKAASSYASVYGFPAYQEAIADHLLIPDSFITIGKTSWNILFLPGHSPGHVGFYQANGKTLISGDVLFNGSVGRTDLPGGNWDVLVQSIKQKVFSLPDDVLVYPGHGPTTTIGEEKEYNPFVGKTAHS
jgi:glyoxylase-like metal-dependent hydrolase (beta-lactamase superfamily II)